MNDSASNDTDATFKASELSTVYTVAKLPGDEFYAETPSRDEAYYYADELFDAGATGVTINRVAVITAAFDGNG